MDLASFDLRFWFYMSRSSYIRLRMSGSLKIVQQLTTHIFFSRIIELPARRVMSWAIWTPKNKKTLEYHSCKKKHVLHLPLSMKSTTSTMFFSSNPRVVRAGVPIRIPPGFNAEVSPGKQEVWKPRAAGKQDASSHLEPCFYLLKCCRVLKPFQLLLHSVPKRNYGGQKEAESLTFKKTLGRTSAKIRWLSVPPDTSCEQCNIETLNLKSDQELEIERLYFVITLGHFRF